MNMPEQTNQEDQEQQDSKPVEPAKDPVRKWTFMILGLCIVLIALYLVADRETPFTARPGSMRLSCHCTPGGRECDQCRGAEQ